MTTNRRYTLEKYKGPATRYICPSCGKRREFTRYADTETGEHLGDNVGMCNRLNSCAYHYTPKQFFEDNPGRRAGKQSGERSLRAEKQTGDRSENKKPKVNIPYAVLESSLVSYNTNLFLLFLVSLFGTATVAKLTEKYKVGTCNGASAWKCAEGASTIFWFINKAQEIRYGQVKQFNPNGHTGKYTDTFDNDRIRSCTTGVHYLLKAKYRNTTLPDWLHNYFLQEKYLDCFFGEHLLGLSEYAHMPIAIVEAPKTAMIASIYMPEYLWLAVGALSYFTAARCEVLKGKDVTLFPDLGAYDKWKQRGNELRYSINFKVSDFLERLPGEQQVKGMDIADHFINYSLKTCEVDEQLLYYIAEMKRYGQGVMNQTFTAVYACEKMEGIYRQAKRTHGYSMEEFVALTKKL